MTMATRVSVAARLDRLPVTRIHRIITVAIGVGLFFDIYEVFLSGVLGTVLITQFSLTKAVLPAVLGSTFVGMFVGAVVMGRVADTIGRRRAFLLNLGVYSLFSLVGAFSVGPVMLMTSRFFAGVGIGAEPPLADSYLGDLLPPGVRGRYTAWAYTLSFLGVPVVGFLARALVPISPLGLAGWRWLFILGSLGSLIVLLIRRGLPESPRWLESVGRHQQARRITRYMEAQARQVTPGGVLREPAARQPVKVVEVGAVRALLRAPYGRRSAMLAVFHVLQTVGYYGFGTLVPLVLAAKGYNVVNSLLFSAITFIGYPLGSALSLPLIDRIERKFLIVGSGVAMAGFGVAFGFAASITPILVFGFCYTAVSNVFSNSYHCYQAEIFPTHLRATATGSTYALSRLTSAAMPFVLVPLLHRAGPVAVFAVVATAMVLVALDVAALGPRTTARTLEQVNADPVRPS